MEKKIPKSMPIVNRTHSASDSELLNQYSTTSHPVLLSVEEIAMDNRQETGNIKSPCWD